AGLTPWPPSLFPPRRGGTGPLWPAPAQAATCHTQRTRRLRTGGRAGGAMAGYFDLGGYTRPVTAASQDAQTWFARGLVWAYAFNHEEAAECFERAATADPGCAMAHWGIAYALGPNYNKPWEAFDEADLAGSLARAHAAAQAAAASAAA